MSDGAAPPPAAAAAAAPAPAAPPATKLPVKIAVGAPGVKLAMKVPMALGVKTVMGKVPIVQPIRPTVPPPKPSTTAPAKTSAPVYKARAAVVDDEDDAELLGITKPLPVAPAPVPKHLQSKPVSVVKKEKIVVKKEKPDQSRPVQRAKRAREAVEESSSSSDDESVEEITVMGTSYDPNDPWAEYLHHWAKRMGWLDMDTSDVQLDADIVDTKIPKPQKISWKTDLSAMLKDIDERIEKLDNSMKIKDGNKTVSLGTSKTNYIDPRIICAWCKRADVPVSRVFNKSLLKKFPWALDIEEDFEF